MIYFKTKHSIGDMVTVGNLQGKIDSVICTRNKNEDGIAYIFKPDSKLYGPFLVGEDKVDYKG